MHLVTQKKKQDLYQSTINLFLEKHPLFFQLKKTNQNKATKTPNLLVSSRRKYKVNNPASNKDCLTHDLLAK